MAQRPPGWQVTRPRTYEVTIKSILTFPFRVCNPPPAVGKVRSCSVTPLFKIHLEDVLDRKHLPPLGLKDFEEWLLYVEESPENLYFTLWLRDYRQRHAAWKAQNKIHRELDGPDFHINWDSHHSPSLALSYARAKQTFFTPNSPYELNVPSSLLAVFHTSTESPHPDPAIFTDVAIETYRMLDESLRRFVGGQFNNVGTQRVLCGIIAGVFFMLLGSVPLIVLNFTRHESRWLRMLVFPGIFLGLTILLSALNGICLGVYIFGDLRQLRKFELARPPISRPVPIGEKPSAPSLASIIPVPAGAKGDAIEDSPPPVSEKPSAPTDGLVARVRPASITSEGHSLYSNTEEDGLSSGGHIRAQIHISPAIYENPSAPELEQAPGNAVSYNFPSPPQADGQLSPVNSDFTITAAFIHPFDASSTDLNEFDLPDFCAARRQPVDAFDFDGLPPLVLTKTHNQLRRRHSTKHYEQSCQDSSTLDIPQTYPSATSGRKATGNSPYPEPSLSSKFDGFLERQQSRCDIKKWRLQTESTDQVAAISPNGHPAASDDPYNAHILNLKAKSRRSLAPTEATLQGCNESVETKVHKRSRWMKAVPAFAVPLTRVLSPVIRRGQWEIVMRSAAVAFVVSWVTAGILLALPAPRS